MSFKIGVALALLLFVSGYLFLQNDARSNGRLTNSSTEVIDKNKYADSEQFYVISLQGNSVAVYLNLPEGEYLVPDSDVVVRINQGEAYATWGNAVLPGYYDNWSAWVNEHQETGTVID